MKIAIVRRNGLGDLLAVMPLVALCKEKYPGCHITLFVDPRNAPLLPYLTGFDEAVIIVHSKNKYMSLLKTLWRNRERSFDLVVSGRPAPMRWVNLFLTGLRAKKRRAVISPSWDAQQIDEPLKYDDKAQRHQMVKCLRILDENIEEVPSRLLPKLNVKKMYQFPPKTVLVSVTNTRVGSQLEPETIASLLNKTLVGNQVILNCEPKDLAKAQKIRELLTINNQVIPTENFDDFMGLLASVDASWTGDGGIMHLMAAMDKPQLVLFGRTPLWEWAPLSEKAICIWHPENVNLIPEHEIEQGLKRLLNELR